MSNTTESSKGSFSNPRTFWGVLPAAFICATIAFIAHLYFAAERKASPRLWVPILVETNGNQNVMGETRQIEFWTPSAKTKDYLHMSNGKVEETEQWQVISNDDAVIQFGVLLRSNKVVLGYRRAEVWGHGTTSYKPGWWWTMTTLTNYTAKDLAQTYQDYWKCHKPVFAEVIDNRGSGEN